MFRVCPEFFIFFYRIRTASTALREGRDDAMGAHVILLSACAVVMVVALVLIDQMKRRDTMSRLLADVLPKNCGRCTKK